MSDDEQNSLIPLFLGKYTVVMVATHKDCTLFVSRTVLFLPVSLIVRQLENIELLSCCHKLLQQ
jgi:hypothetical protein